jgi:hypothetical protein
MYLLYFDLGKRGVVGEVTREKKARGAIVHKGRSKILT